MHGKTPGYGKTSDARKNLRCTEKLQDTEKPQMHGKTSDARKNFRTRKNLIIIIIIIIPPELRSSRLPLSSLCMPFYSPAYVPYVSFILLA
jgi:hypothetical protein